MSVENLQQALLEVYQASRASELSETTFAGLEAIAIYNNTSGASGVVDSVNYKGTWNCSGGTFPTLASKGYAYVCSVAGTISGTQYRIGDWLVYNGTIWNKITGNDIVISVNGQSGVVSLTLDDIENGVTYGKLTNAQITDLTDTGNSTAHYHSADRDRSVHSGTQTAATISDFDTEVSNNTDVAANTLARHSAVTIEDTASLDLILTGQALSGIVLPAGVDHDQLLNTHSKLMFKTIAVSGQSDIVADSDTDTLSFSPSSGIALSTNATTDTLTVTNIDLGSVSRTAHESAYDHALLHSPVTVSDSLSIDLTLDGQNISGVVLPAGIDHNSLAGVVTGDVHTQYTLLAGRSGGQVIRGGTGASENLVLNSTSHATQGKVLISGTVGINVNDPDTQLEIMSTNNQLKLSYDGTNNCAFGVDVSGDVTITTNGSGIIIPDDKILGIGAGKDGQLYSNSDNFYIKNATVDKDIIFQCNEGGVKVEAFRVKGSVGAITVPNALYYSCTDNGGTAINTLGITSANHTHIRAVVGNMILENDYSDGDIIFKVNDGGVDTTMATFDGSESTFALKTGVGINEFSNDGTLGGNSDLAVPTEKAVKTYVDAQSASSGVVNEGVTATNISGIISGDGSFVRVAKNDAGGSIISFSTDGTLAGNTDVDVPTEKAIKTYADMKIPKLTFWDWTDKVSGVAGNFTITNIDGISKVFVTTGSSNVNVALPSRAGNVNRTILVQKIDSGTGIAYVSGVAGDTINNAPTYSIAHNKGWIEVTADNTEWRGRSVSSLYPVGSFYVQYPDAASNTDATAFPTSTRPATLFGGTWVEQFGTDNVFFKTGNVDGQTRTDGLSADQMQKMTGSYQLADNDTTGGQIRGINTAGALAGGSNATQNFANVAAASGTGRTAIDFDSSLSPNARVSSETTGFTEPRNRLMKVWKRTVL